jgi:hypothetical protein
VSRYIQAGAQATVSVGVRDALSDAFWRVRFRVLPAPACTGGSFVVNALLLLRLAETPLEEPDTVVASLTSLLYHSLFTDRPA